MTVTEHIILVALVVCWSLLWFVVQYNHIRRLRNEVVTAQKHIKVLEESLEAAETRSKTYRKMWISGNFNSELKSLRNRLTRLRQLVAEHRKHIAGIERARRMEFDHRIALVSQLQNLQTYVATLKNVNIEALMGTTAVLMSTPTAETVITGKAEPT
jgi:hypothetical protein